ncbi:putative AbiEi antitoxin of type IV toxin-antitoxin system [Kribbella voronezhensis]|uniref:Putative AbiEi antitoxin of type IV toxin-antitoxin system n=1 Tax=Kribbella voronezhensis TaxID=2512212 RepID=A0A4R7TGN9_9ACTN|nr:type IV toxin-antitoxin system AbiEi family antitoxin domain-containing protein [Kribbella voronezhensis]TDU90668.1 putative AbiEi antitoxin of type IV toxin-antitoxin system [Kribbella voronezhensis]
MAATARRRATADLPDTFTAARARTSGLSRRQLYTLRNHGSIEPLARGLYRKRDAPAADLDLIAAARKAPLATLCLTTALARHGLTDAIPATNDIAIPRGTRRPAINAPIQWHSFDAATFELGRGSVELDETTSIGIYSAERSIVDAFRTRGLEGHELGYEALRRWLRRPGSQPGELLDLANRLPRASGPLRHALEVLL